jgi:hypothetical protein
MKVRIQIASPRMEIGREWGTVYLDVIKNKRLGQIRMTE